MVVPLITPPGPAGLGDSALPAAVTAPCSVDFPQIRGLAQARGTGTQPQPATATATATAAAAAPPPPGPARRRRPLYHLGHIYGPPPISVAGGSAGFGIVAQLRLGLKGCTCPQSQKSSIYLCRHDAENLDRLSRRQDGH